MDDITEMDKSDHAGSYTKCLTKSWRFSLVPKKCETINENIVLSRDIAIVWANNVSIIMKRVI